MRAAASSISAAVSSPSRLKRSELLSISGGNPIAFNTGDGSLLPLAQALPRLAPTPARSSATNNSSPPQPGKATDEVFGSRGAPAAWTTAPQSSISRRSSRSRRAAVRVRPGVEFREPQLQGEGQARGEGHRFGPRPQAPLLMPAI